MKARVGFTIDSEVMEEIDNMRGLAGRSAFINHIIKLGLKSYKAPEKKPKSTKTETTEAKMEAHADG
jgi:metal-responsive CopG/Arc/MetJ family transcriptional regulator